MKKYFICRRTPLLFPLVPCICSFCAVACNHKIQYSCRSPCYKNGSCFAFDKVDSNKNAVIGKNAPRINFG